MRECEDLASDGLNGQDTAAGVIMFIPTLLFGFIAQRYLIKGLTLGGVKE